MCKAKLAVQCSAAVAAAVLLVACGGDDSYTGESATAAIADARVRTPLVDDDGWPMPADDPPATPPGGGDGATQ